MPGYSTKKRKIHLFFKSSPHNIKIDCGICPTMGHLTQWITIILINQADKVAHNIGNH